MKKLYYDFIKISHNLCYNFLDETAYLHFFFLTVLKKKIYMYAKKLFETRPCIILTRE